MASVSSKKASLEGQGPREALKSRPLNPLLTPRRLAKAGSVEAPDKKQIIISGRGRSVGDAQSNDYGAGTLYGQALTGSGSSLAPHHLDSGVSAIDLTGRGPTLDSVQPASSLATAGAADARPLQRQELPGFPTAMPLPVTTLKINSAVPVCGQRADNSCADDCAVKPASNQAEPGSPTADLLAATQMQLAEVRRREADLVSEIQTKEVSANLLRGQMVSQLSELANLRFSVGALTFELEAAQEDVRQRDDQVAHLSAQVSAFERQLAEQQALVKSLSAEAREQELASTKAECKKRERAILELQRRLTTLQQTAVESTSGVAKIEQAQRTIEEQLHQLDERSKRIERLEKEVAGQAETLKKQAEAFNKRGKTIEELRELMKQKETEAADLAANLAAEMSAAEATAAEAVRILDLVAQHGGVSVGFEPELAKLKTACLRKADTSAHPRDRDSSLLRDQLMHYEQRFCTSEAARGELQDQCERLTGELASMKEVNAELRQKREDLAQQYTALRSEVQHLQLEGARNCALIQKLAAVEGELEIKSQELAAEKEEGSKLGAQLAVERASVQASTGEVLRLSGAIAGRDGLIAGLQAKVRELGITISARDVTLASLTVELGQRHTDVADLQADIAHLEESIAEREGELRSALQAHALQVAKLQAEVSAAAALAEDSRKLVASRDTCLVKAESEAAELRLQIRGLEDARAELGQRLAAEEELRAHTVSELAAAHSSLEDASKRESELQEAYNAFMEHLVEVTGQGVELHAQLQELRTQRDCEVAALNKRLSVADAHLSNVTAEWQHSRAEVARLQVALAETEALAKEQAAALAVAKASDADMVRQLTKTKLELENSVVWCKVLEGKLASHKVSLDAPCTET